MRTLTLIISLVALVVAPAAWAPTVNVVVPGGFRVTTFASGLEHPTAMAWGPDGRLYVTQDIGNVVVTRSGSRRPVVVARGLRTPLGLAWLEDDLYVSEQGRLSRYSRRDSSLVGRRIVLRGLPFGRHQQDNVVVGPDGRLYLGSGSTCDVCRERDRRSATILSLRPDGSDLRIVARGLRNPYGLVFHGRRLLVSVNNQDELGPSEPAETIVVIRTGADYGWPRCWPSWRERRLVGDCAGVARPFAYLEPHSSANGMAIWRGALYVAEWGQYLSRRWGRKVVRVDLRTGRARDFADGFDHPLALAADRDGGLLVADWRRGLVYRIAAA
jgi:glucose/arabinose dehydrogenase